MPTGNKATVTKHEAPVAARNSIVRPTRRVQRSTYKKMPSAKIGLGIPSPTNELQVLRPHGTLLPEEIPAKEVHREELACGHGRLQPALCPRKFLLGSNLLEYQIVPSHGMQSTGSISQRKSSASKARSHRSHSLSAQDAQHIQCGPIVSNAS